ncbi:hypothetical protein JAAARDRAFT_39808 [Jaapia argillacea MUCL 33604]|uniref:Uncharacterized protein n=1 Tax=Jaapia argillacea MUCL 33604 TaxID=933084 RepID=A0A067PNF5_9AGAM|nr:hypothetical protein JAAARDRAFT_39808 [Jaapia argillacea MUCL 33604]
MLPPPYSLPHAGLINRSLDFDYNFDLSHCGGRRSEPRRATRLIVEARFGHIVLNFDRRGINLAAQAIKWMLTGVRVVLAAQIGGDLEVNFSMSLSTNDRHGLGPHLNAGLERGASRFLLLPYCHEPFSPSTSIVADSGSFNSMHDSRRLNYAEYPTRDHV